MFSGIVENIGKISAIEPAADAIQLAISSALFAIPQSESGLKLGSSIMVNGVCLTAVRYEEPQTIWFDVGAETQRMTALGELRQGAEVNLERALQAGARIDGHFVQGHVDGVETVLQRIEEKHGVQFVISKSEAISPYIAFKGSVCVDGVSLTIGKVEASSFSVHIVPHTMAVTTFKNFAAGRKVNIETDCLARYLENLLKERKAQ